MLCLLSYLHLKTILNSGEGIHKFSHAKSHTSSEKPKCKSYPALLNFAKLVALMALMISSESYCMIS